MTTISGPWAGPAGGWSVPAVTPQAQDLTVEPVRVTLALRTILRCSGYRRVVLDDHLRTLGGPGRGGVSPGRCAPGARSNCSRSDCWPVRLRPCRRRRTRAQPPRIASRGHEPQLRSGLISRSNYLQAGTLRRSKGPEIAICDTDLSDLETRTTPKRPHNHARCWAGSSRGGTTE